MDQILLDAFRAGVEFARSSSPRVTRDIEPQPLGCDWDGCPANFPDIYEVFAEVTGRDYTTDHEDELLILRTSAAWEDGYFSVID